MKWYDPNDLTPIEMHGGHLVKRDDLCRVGAVRGGKVRTCLALARGATGLITAGSRHSPQVAIVAAIANYLGIPCRVHTPQGTLGPVVQWAKDNGAEVVQHKAGYNSVIKCRAADDSAACGWRLIPFGMECSEAVKQTARQTKNIPPDTKRIVIPVGSGMSLAGLLTGINDKIPVLGVVVGADPTSRLNAYAPFDLRGDISFTYPNLKLVNSLFEYSDSCFDQIGDLELDPIYEAKCVDFLRAGDLLWVVGHREIID